MKKALALLAMVGVVGVVVGLVGLLRLDAVDANKHSATRTFSAASVPAGNEFIVTVTAADYGALWNLWETLPAGFTYVGLEGEGEVDLDPATGRETVNFTVFTPSLMYTVRASMVAGDHSFQGEVADFSFDPSVESTRETVGGVAMITVIGVEPTPEPTLEPTPEVTPEPTLEPTPEVTPEPTLEPTPEVTPEPTQAVPTASATRSFPPDPVEPGEQLVVTITPSDLGGFGSVVETLPTGFSYVSSDIGAENVVCRRADHHLHSVGRRCFHVHRNRFRLRREL